MSKEVNFYEVYDNKMNVEWGGASESEAIAWFRRGLDRSIFVTVWDESDPDNPVPVSGKTDISRIILAALVEARR